MPGAAALCEACCSQLFQMGHIVGLIIDGRHPLAGRKEFRSFNTLNAAWVGISKLLLAVPPDCRPAILQLKGGHHALVVCSEPPCRLCKCSYLH